MKVVVNSPQPEKRKLVAVVTEGERGLFVRSYDSNTIYLSPDGHASKQADSLERLLELNPRRTPIYEGDRVTLEF